MKNNLYSIFFDIFFLILSGLLLTGCGSEFPDSPAFPAEEESEAEHSAPNDTTDETDSKKPFSHVKPQTAPTDADYVFPDTAPFIDDTGKPMQRDGNFLYSYHNGKLIQFDKETKETALLYETASTRKLNFCLYENSIYFVERTGCTSLDDKDTSLWRVDKDGKNLTLLQDDIYNVGGFQYPENYSIDIYDDIIYLINYTSEYDSGTYVTNTANLYYRLENDGTVSELEESETLYGTLPYRFSPICDFDFPSFPYAMRNYGYIFVQDSMKRLYRMDPAGGACESLTISANSASCFVFSGDMVFLYTYIGDEISLYNLSEKAFVMENTPLPESISYYDVFVSEQGFFLCGTIWGEDTSPDESPRFDVLQVLPDGSTETLFTGFHPAFEDVYLNVCIFEDCLYCYSDEITSHRLICFPLTENSSFQELGSWLSWQTSSPAVFVTKEKTDETKIGDVSSVYHYAKELLLEENTAAERQINQTLTEVYTDFETYVEELIQEEQKDLEDEPDFYENFEYTSGYDFTLDVSCDYMDDNTISFCFSYYQYYAFAAHGYYWNDYYVFDRRTGKRLSFEDFAGNSSSILRIALPYVERAAGWDDFDSEMILEISRFSLSEDGYTLYFAPYDIDCYAAGSFLITIPYEAFEQNL